MTIQFVDIVGITFFRSTFTQCDIKKSKPVVNNYDENEIKCNEIAGK